MCKINKPVKTLTPGDIIGVRDITNPENKMFLLVMDNDQEKVTGTLRKGFSQQYFFSIKDGLSLPPDANLEIYMTPDRRRDHEIYGDERRANLINWD